MKSVSVLEDRGWVHAQSLSPLSLSSPISLSRSLYASPSPFISLFPSLSPSLSLSLFRAAAANQATHDLLSKYIS